MPVIPKTDGKGYPGFIYLAYHSKLAGKRIIRTVGQAKADTGLNLGNSFAYLTQCRGGQQIGPKRTPESGYRLVDMPGLNRFMHKLTSSQVATVLGIPEKQILRWTATPSVESGDDQRTANPAPARQSTPLTSPTPLAAAQPPSHGQLEAVLAKALAPVVEQLKAVKGEQQSLRSQIDYMRGDLADVRNSAKLPAAGGSTGLEMALVSMIELLRDLPNRLVGEQTTKVTEMLLQEGKHTGRALRSLRETLEFQNREIAAVLAKVADSLTKLLASKDSTLMSLANSLQSALSLVPEEPEEAPLPLPAAAATTPRPLPPVPASGNGGSSK